MEVSNVFGSHELMRFNYSEALAKGPTQEAEFDADVLGAIDRHGFVVIEDALPVSTCERLLQEMRPYIDATPHGLHGLGGTRRVGALVARSSASHQMISHPGILRLVDSILAEQQLNGDAVKIGGKAGKGRKDFRYPWQLHLTQVIDVGPGGGTKEMPHSLRCLLYTSPSPRD